MADGPLDEDQLAAIFAHSQHLRSLARAHPDLIAAVPQGRGGAEVTAAIAACEQAADQLTDESGMMAALRRLRGRCALCVALADMADMADVETQMAWLSDAAEAAIRSAVTFLFRQADVRGRFGEADAEARAGRAGCGWMVLALGKLGARELNYSSDVDLILLHDPDANPACRPGAKPGLLCRERPRACPAAVHRNRRRHRLAGRSAAPPRSRGDRRQHPARSGDGIL